MKKSIIVILLIILGTGGLKAAQPGWEVNPSNFSNSMVMVGALVVDDVMSVDKNDMVAAFINGQLRGVAKLQYVAAADRYLAYLIIYGNSSGATISFKMYNADQDAVVDVVSTATFQIDASAGNVASPHIWANIFRSSESSMLSFRFPESVGAAIITSNTIEVTVPYITDLSSLVAEFTTSSLATVSKSGVAQQSGATFNDFTSPVIYRVLAEDKIHYTDYTVTIVLTKNPPPTGFEVRFVDTRENNIINRTIAIISPKDDADDSHILTLVSGFGDTHNSSFEISGNSIIAKTIFDYETRPFYFVRVRVKDSYDQYFEDRVTIYISDVNEAPTINDVTFSLNENSVAGFQFGTVSAKDPDGDAVTYSFEGASAFAVNSSSGTLAVSNPSVLDYETSTQFVFKVSASDGTLSSTATVVVNLLDLDEYVNKAPVLEDQFFSIEENSPKNYYIAALQASDDAGSKLTYSILSGNELGGFSLNETSGALLVADQSQLDFETNPVFNLKVQVSDGELKDDAAITIQLKDVAESINKAPQIANQVFSINENSKKGAEVGKVVASDPEGDLISFSIEGDAKAFTLDKSSGVLSIQDSSMVDFELNKQFVLTVKASDESLSTSATIIINIIDVDEKVNAAPSLADQEFWIDENSANNNYIGTLEAIDEAGSKLTYTIVTGNDLGVFSLNEITGVLLVADQSRLDFEVNPVFKLLIRVSDGELTDDALITINLNDVEEIVLGVADNINLKIYPNPTRDFISVESDRFIELIEGYDLQGIKVFSTIENQVNVASLPSGMYYLFIYHSQIVEKVKFIKN